MLEKVAYGFVALISLAGCQTMKDLRPSWAATNPVDKGAEPAFQQYVAGANAEGPTDSDAATLTATSNRIDQAAALAASGSRQAYSKSESDISSYQADRSSRRSESSECSSGCCSN